MEIFKEKIKESPLDEKYELLIEKHFDSINKWNEKINHYVKLDITKVDREVYLDKTIEIAKTLHEILDVWINYGRFKDTWIDPTFLPNIEGIEIHIKSKKTNQIFDFGLDRNGLYLQFYIQHIENIKNMHDEFWLEFLSLSQYGEFNFNENGGHDIEIRRKYPHLFKQTKSNLYRLIRNYFIDELIIDSNENVKCETGWITVQWAPKLYATDEILILGCEAFKILYKLNYLLWKANK